ncbi:FAD/NAD(P)-binding domain-containing protein [Leucogyrophana mollusca]|uniref:FAD/NAD(P)-binding domain-containing protein n=1 Tax=Leucogyrophana mollusca TaxID=85980 RepID=A0ACB8BBM3_9AGAM|nr:FAD/NAD(P)-binding domain-containing protein [Leucogyrophana mollusca]
MAIQSIPTSTQILVIGGGPAGSYAAAALAREGFSVVLMEATKFPRYHIGESMLPSVRPFLKFIGAEDLVRNYGFTVKPGAAIKLNQYKREGYTDFVSLDPNNGSWNVVRSEFDELLLRHASSCGTTVVEETRVTELHFKSSDLKRPVAASYKTTSGTEGRIDYEYLVDASGRNGIMSTKYLKNRRFNKSLNNVACWGYWEGTGSYMPGTIRENAIWVEALNDETGWAWFIPLHDGSTSVGVVMDQNESTRKKKSSREAAASSGYGLQDHYLEELTRAPGLLKLLGEAKLRNRGQPDAIKATSDFSYSATDYAGDHFRLAGDAGAFIDPFFSSGVHLAFTGGLSAALTIAASIRESVQEEKAQLWHNAKVATSYTRFLLVVLGTYKQMRNQAFPVMSDVDEDNFDRAFDLIRPVIQGTADVGKTLTEDELQKTMDFCRHLFAPTDPEMYEAVGARLNPELLSSAGPILSEADVDLLVGDADEEAKHVLHEVNARKPIHTMYQPVDNFEAEAHVGFKAVLERGRLGLVTQ